MSQFGTKWVQVRPGESKWVQVSQSGSKWNQRRTMQVQWGSTHPILLITRKVDLSVCYIPPHVLLASVACALAAEVQRRLPIAIHDVQTSSAAYKTGVVLLYIMIRSMNPLTKSVRYCRETAKLLLTNSWDTAEKLLRYCCWDTGWMFVTDWLVSSAVYHKYHTSQYLIRSSPVSHQYLTSISPVSHQYRSIIPNLTSISLFADPCKAWWKGAREGLIPLPHLKKNTLSAAAIWNLWRHHAKPWPAP